MNVTYTDNQDGTGITVTVSGSSGTHEIFLQDLIGQPDEWQFLKQGEIVGNGSLVVSHAGAFFAYVRNGSSLSPVRFGNATDGQSIHHACLVAVQARLRLISLEGVQNEDIVIKKLPSDRGTNFELNGTTTIVISPPGTEGQSDGAGTNSRDDIEYPVIVTILRADNQHLSENLNQGLLWREKINQAFRHQRLPGVPSVYKVKVQPGPVVDQSAFWNGRYHSSFIIRPISRERRGI